MNKNYYVSILVEVGRATPVSLILIIIYLLVPLSWNVKEKRKSTKRSAIRQKQIDRKRRYKRNTSHERRGHYDVF